MKHNRWLYVIFSMLLCTAPAAWAIDIDIDSAVSDFTDNIAEDAGRSAEDVDALATDLRKILTEGNEDALKTFMDENSKILKDSGAIDNQLKGVASEQKAALEETAAAAEKTEGDLVDGAGGNEPELTPEQKAANDLKYRKLDRTLDSGTRVKNELKSDVKGKVRKSFEDYANDRNKFKDDPAALGKKYKGILKDRFKGFTPGTIKAVCEKMGTTEDRLEAELTRGTPEQIEAAAGKVAILRGLSGVGDILKDLEEDSTGAAGAELAGIKTMLDDAIDDNVAAMEKLQKKIKDDKGLFDKKASKGAAGNEPAGGPPGAGHAGQAGETVTSGLSTLLDEIGADLDKGIDERFNTFSSDIKIKMRDIDAEGGVSSFTKKNPFFRNPNELRRAGLRDLNTKFRDLSAKGVLKSIGEGMRDLGSSVLRQLESKGEMLLSALIFMIPNIFQSAIQAQERRAEQLALIGKPIKFGNYVLQIPDCCINLEHPDKTIPIYVLIPVNEVGDAVSTAASNYYGGAITAGAPSTNNAISRGINNAGSDIMSLGSTAGDGGVARYKMTSTFLLLTDLVVAYGSGGMSATGATLLTSSEFTGQVISLRTGMVTDASGDVVDVSTIQDSKCAPLIKMLQWGGIIAPQQPPMSVYDQLDPILSSLELAPGITPSATLKKMLDTNCVKNDGALKVASCENVIVDALTLMADGITLGKDGSVSGIGQTTKLGVQTSTMQVIDPVMMAGAAAGSRLSTLGRLSPAATSRPKPAAAPTVAAPAPTAETIPNWNGLGAVVPVFGWGKNYSNIISPSAFPEFEISTTTVPGLDTTATVGAASGTDSSYKFAGEDTQWAAQGCWIYLCSNTPFAQYLSAGATASPVGAIADYIVFLDELGSTILPLMVPVTVDVEFDATHSYKKPHMTLNPKIKYWASLITYSLPDFAASTESVPEMYGLDGTVYNGSQLGAIGAQAAPQQGSAPAGTINAFLTAAAGLPGVGQGISVGFPEIYQQFLVHSAALIAKFNNMPTPYTNCALSQSSSNTASINQAGATTAIVYKGSQCFASSIPDLLVPLTAYTSGTTTPLGASPAFSPLPGGTYAVSLITDICYQLSGNNSWEPYDFSNCPLNLNSKGLPEKVAGSYDVDLSNAATLNFLNDILDSLNAGTVTPPATTATPIADTPAQTAMLASIGAMRTAWLRNMSVTQQLGTGSTAITCSLAAGLSRKQTKATGSYIYELSPSPTSSLVSGTDYFVAVNTTAPSLSELAPMSISAAAAAANGTLVSLITGTLYDMTGNPLTSPSRLAVNSGATTTSGQATYNALTAKFASLPAAFTSAYQASLAAYEGTQTVPMGPYAFGSKQVGIRTGDNNAGVYVYFNAGGMQKSNFAPRSMYVILTSVGGTPTNYDSTQTQYLLDLVTGITYDQNGIMVQSMILSQSALTAQISNWSSGWSPWITANLINLQAAFKAQQQACASEDAGVLAAVEAFTAQHDSAANKDQATIKGIIGRLKPMVPPFSELMFDPTTKQYVQTSPAGTDATSGLLYLFMGNGKVYAADGSYRRTYLPAHLESVQGKLGVVVNATTGVQTLGIPMLQPSLLLPDADQAITPGTSGSSMIVSTDPSFPGDLTTMPAGYSLYYSKIMDVYYALSSKKQWMSIDGGHLYEQNGAPVMQGHAVAQSAGGSLMLLKENSSGVSGAFMGDGCEYSDISTSASVMSWLGLSSPYKTISVKPNAASTAFKVGIREYKVKKNIKWYSLALVPIDSSGAVLATIPGSAYYFAQLVLDGANLTNLLYNRTMYEVSSTVSSGVYAMSPVLATSTAPDITVSIGEVDLNTNAPYVTIQDGNNLYMYCYEPKSFTQAEQTANRNLWKGATAASPIPLPVGPMINVSKIVNGKTLTATAATDTTHTMFARDLPASKSGALTQPAAVTARSVANAPTSGTAQATFGIGLTNVSKTKDGRFLCAISAGSSTAPQPGTISFDYVQNASYVDLATGALFDLTSGIATGQCLNIMDLLKVLDSCSVVVTKNSKGVNGLVYRSGGIATEQAATIEANSSLVGASGASVVTTTPQSTIGR